MSKGVAMETSILFSFAGKGSFKSVLTLNIEGTLFYIASSDHP
jgi:hypothetical protein